MSLALRSRWLDVSANSWGYLWEGSGVRGQGSEVTGGGNAPQLQLLHNLLVDHVWHVGGDLARVVPVYPGQQLVDKPQRVSVDVHEAATLASGCGVGLLLLLLLLFLSPILSSLLLLLLGEDPQLLPWQPPALPPPVQ